MGYLRALTNPVYALERIRYYGPGRIVINQAKAFPALLPITFKALRAAKIAADPAGYKRRRQLAREMSSSSKHRGFFSPVSGYTAAPPGTFDAIDRIIPVARQVCDNFMKLYPTGRMKPDDFSSYLLFDHSKPASDHMTVDLRAHPEFQRLASDPALLEIASIYLGEVPILGSINLQIIQPNDATVGYQRFHIDGGGNVPRQLKIFIAVEDVDEGNGATMIVPADVSRAIADSLNYRTGRIPDETLMSEKWSRHVVSACGKAGTAFFFDTCRSIHAGARARTGPRKLVMLQYISKYISGETALQRGRIAFDRDMANRDELSRLLFAIK